MAPHYLWQRLVGYQNQGIALSSIYEGLYEDEVGNQRIVYLEHQTFYDRNGMAMMWEQSPVTTCPHIDIWVNGPKVFPKSGGEQ